MNHSLKTPAVIFVFLFLLGIALMSNLQSALQGTTLTLGVDVYPRWIGSQAALQGQSPYSFETRQLIWEAIYGSPELPNGNPFGFYYPPSIVTLLVPFIALGISVQQAAILGCAFLWAVWGVFFFTWLTQLQGQHRWTVLLILLSGLFFRPAFSNYILGQATLFCAGVIWLGWVFQQRKWDVAAGVCFALALIKPSVSVLAIMALLTLNYRNKKMILSFVLANVFLFIPPTFLLGWWIPDFLADIAKYSLENAPAWTAANSISLPGLINLLLSGGLLIWAFRQRDGFLLVASACAFNAIFVPHTADYDLVIFIFLILWAYEQSQQVIKNKVATVLILLMLLWLPWVSLLSFDGQVEDWYLVIWNIYPSLILIISAFFAFGIAKQRTLERMDNHG